MGFWNDGVRSRSRSRSPSRRKSSSHNNPYYASRPSASRSASSFFSLGGGGGSSRGYSSRARPRSGFMARIRKFIRDLYSYMRRNPIKVFMLVIMPLITGGALTKILGQFGVRLPAGLQQFAGGGRGQDRFYSRGGARDFEGGSSLPGMSGGFGGMGSALGTVAGIAKNFL